MSDDVSSEALAKEEALAKSDGRAPRQVGTENSQPKQKRLSRKYAKPQSATKNSQRQANANSSDHKSNGNHNCKSNRR